MTVYLVYGSYVNYVARMIEYDEDLDDYYDEEVVTDLLFICANKELAENAIDKLSRFYYDFDETYSSFFYEEHDVIETEEALLNKGNRRRVDQ